MATLAAALIASMGMLLQRKKEPPPEPISELRFQAALDVARDNRDALREIQWKLTALATALEAQGKALGDAANVIQELIRRRS